MSECAKEALLYEKLSNSRVRCKVCQWYCILNPDKFGICKVRKNQDGKLITFNYAKTSSVAVDPIEKKPLYHFYPSSLCLSFGTLGCNFHCLHCQNYMISCTENPFTYETAIKYIPAEKAVLMAKENNCAGIAWTYNEPSVWFEYTLDTAKLAKSNNLYTVYVTNGFLSTEALDFIGPYLDCFRVDIKAFTDNFYQQIAKIKKWRGILEVTKRAKFKWNMHIEVVTNIIPKYNDDIDQLNELASWIKNELGDLTPWHVTRFYPHYKLTNIPPTPIKTLEMAANIGFKTGLKFVYIGNVPGHELENTKCYQCGNTIIRRLGYNTEIIGLKNSKCLFCNADVNIRQ